MSVSFLEQGRIRGFLHHPPDAAQSPALVLAHGAGSDSRSALLLAFATAFCQAGFFVLRMDLPFRQKRQKGPPTPAMAVEDRAGLLDAGIMMRELARGALVLGGHSYGGRQASILAAENNQSADALLLLSYPLHPPSQPSRLRTSHWPDLRTPSFFVHGAKDPFGSIDEIEAALPLIPAPTALVTIPNAGHDLKRGTFAIESVVINPMRSFCPWPGA